MSTFSDPDVQIEATAPPKSKGNFGRWVVWLVVLSLMLLFVTLNFVGLTIKDLNTPMMDELSMMEETLVVTLPPAPEAEALSSTLVSIHQQIAGLLPVQTELASQHFDWPSAMQYIANYDPTLITLQSIIQSEAQITLSGEANDEAVVIAYADTLKASNQFARVVVQSISVYSLPSPTPADPAAVVSPSTTAYRVEFTLVLERGL